MLENIIGCAGYSGPKTSLSDMNAGLNEDAVEEQGRGAVAGRRLLLAIILPDLLL